MTTLRTVAVGYDGSPDANRAVRWVFGLAGQFNVNVVMVHAVGMLEHLERGPIVRELEESIASLAEEFHIDPSHVRLHVANGDACSVMLRAAEEPISADLLVVGSRGQGAHVGLLLGSTSLQLAEHSTIPLVIVPSETEA